MIAPPAHDVILVGIGHTNAHVLRMWRMEPLKGMRLTCVSDEAVATYSGMLPGVLAGQYPPERMEIDLVRLTATAGARLIVDEVTGLDPARQELLFDSRAPVRFDVLSVGIGSVPGWGGVQEWMAAASCRSSRCRRSCRAWRSDCRPRRPSGGARRSASSRSARTDRSGRYVIGAVPPGSYDLRFSLANFVSSLRRDIAIAAGRTAAHDATLYVAATASVIVSGRARFAISRRSTRLTH